jgi:ferredoxin
VSREEALAALDEFEKIGLVHTVSNVASKISYVCNCCGCCCGILRSLLEGGVEGSMAHANYYATVDADACTGCGNCETRCQVGAIKVRGGASEVNRDKCIGCGLCVSGCPVGAVILVLKPEDQIVEPPTDMGEWSRLRKESRGLNRPRGGA